jgi:sulfide:quinone oxidoreductase
MTEAVVAGGGVAALEFVLALRALAGDRLSVTVVAPEPDFVLRPLLVAEPLGAAAPVRLPLAALAADIGFRLITATLDSVDSERHRVILRSGDALAYDTLVLGLGARTLPAFDDALHLGDAEGALGLTALHDEIRRGTVHSVAFVAPAATSWLLPLYEAALLTANSGYAVDVTLVTPEAHPLEHFGAKASAAVAQALRDAGITMRGDAIAADRIVTVPLLRGPQIPGVPVGGLYGLIAVDGYARVRDVRDVYAIGDATDFPVKQAAVACLQADAAAAHVAARHGHLVTSAPFDPELRATLLTGRGEPILLNGGQGPNKLPGRLLGPYLALTLG